MTPTDKAIKALKRNREAAQRFLSRNDTGRGLAQAVIAQTTQALAELSSVRLEEGDVEWLKELQRHYAQVQHFGDADTVGRLLSALGHGGEG